MADKIRMTLLIDEHSHPELYADLIDIDGDRNRTERVRYLAGIGLVLGQVYADLIGSNRNDTLKRLAAVGLLLEQQGPRRRRDTAQPQESKDAASQRSSPHSAPLESTEQVRPILRGTKPPSPNDSPGTKTPMTDPASQAPPNAATRAARQMAAAGLFGQPSTSRTS